jgi:glutathione S-transferase
MPQTMLYTLVAGLKWPNAAAALAGAWVIARCLFLYGYIYSGKPQGKGRMYGAPFWLFQGALWAMSVFGVARELINY